MRQMRTRIKTVTKRILKRISESMPTYEYRREDGSIFEHNQSIKDDALTVCPTTGQKVTRIISGGTGLIFKGTGFYLTDYARKNASSGAPGESKSEANSSDTPAKTEVSKPADSPTTSSDKSSTK